jgi:Fe2+ or Zn2+ uptake regulation protein
MSLETYIGILREKGLKATPKRKAVLELMLADQSYFSPRDIWNKLKHRFPSLGLTSVYRILEKFEDIDLICRVNREDRQLYYFLCDSEDHHHHHFICRKCHGVQEVNQCYSDIIYSKLREELGVKAESHFLQIEGVCRECQ